MSPTGAASIDPQGASASINIGASDEPHGVFSFAPGSLGVATPEGNTTVQLFVERKYGAIGKCKFIQIIIPTILTLNISMDSEE